MENIVYQPIGIVHSPFKNPKDMPIQPAAAKSIRGTVEILPRFTDGLADVDGFSHIYLIYHFHRSEGYQLKVTPFLDNRLRGVFATRAPKRPNAIGLSLVRLIGLSSNVITIENVDILDGTPLLDIKPFVPEMNDVTECKTGWLEGRLDKINNKKSDDRFSE